VTSHDLSMVTRKRVGSSVETDVRCMYRRTEDRICWQTLRVWHTSTNCHGSPGCPRPAWWHHMQGIPATQQSHSCGLWKGCQSPALSSLPVACLVTPATWLLPPRG